MNLLYCIPALYNPGGMERIISEKLNWLVASQGYEVTIMTTEQRGRTSFFEIDERISQIHLPINFDDAFTLPLMEKVKLTKAKLKTYQQRLQQIIIEKQIDICISTGGKELEFFYKLNVPCRKILEIHFAKNFREQFLLARKDNLLNRIVGKIRTRQLIAQTKSLDAVVVLTKNDYKEWKKTHKNIHQIYNFSSINSDVSPDYGKKRAIAVGRLDAQKGFDMLINAWAQKKEYLVDWTLDIFGKGEWESMLNEQIFKHGLQNNIFLKGVSNNVHQEFSNSSIFLFPSRYEGFALVMMEAMNCGLPVISFDCPHGPSEIIEDGKTGFLIAANDITAFSKAMVQLSSDEILRYKMGKASKAKSSEFSKETIMQQWDNLFHQLK